MTNDKLSRKVGSRDNNINIAEAGKIKKENLLKFLDSLKNKVNLLAPQTDEYGDTYLARVKDAKKVQFKHFKPLMPVVREVLFGQIEDMIKYEKSGKGVKLEDVDVSEETIIFGLPNCDIDGILYNDNFFAGREFADSYYKRARDKLTLISVVCVTPPNDTCFCASMGHGPVAEKGFDLQLTDLGDGSFLVDVGSEKGKKLVASGSFEKASAADISKFADIKKKADKAATKDVDKKKTLENMGRKPLDERQIKEITDRCIACGACNYTCPTCTCFNVIDLGDEKGGVRKRILDSCILGGYFRMAGGHNPKGENNLRTRNRYFCKLIWDKEKFGDSGCVGCGRCLDSCPVDIDIKEVMKSIAGGK